MNTPGFSRSLRLGATLSLALLGSGCPLAEWLGDQRWPSTPPKPEELVVQVTRSYPHDRDSFTQGLLYHRGAVYESTGLVGHSSLRRVTLTSGQVEAEVKLPEPLFAEGLARVGDRLIQLTWKNGRAFVWNLGDLTALGEHQYGGEGWGLCQLERDGRLVMSDGSNRLTLRDPVTFASTGELPVQGTGMGVSQLNELECVGGVIYANIWQSDRIARIDAATGVVTAWIDASALLSPEERAGADVLNGIAYVPERGTFLLTGKLWPRLFEVTFVPRSTPVSVPAPPSR